MIQLSKHLKAVNQGDNDSIVYTGTNGGTQTILFNGAGIYINGTEITDAVVGVDPTPVVRTNNPIVGTNTVNANIDALDAAIGVDITPCAPRVSGACLAANSVNANIDALDLAIGDDISPVTRTNNPIAAANDILANLSKLDTAIGPDSDLTVVTRTAGQVVVNSTLMAKVDALDAGIGFDAQMSGTGKVVNKTATVFQNLDALDTYKSVETIKKTISWSGGTGTFKLPSSGDMAVTNIDLGSIVPARARVLDVFIVCTVASVFSGGATTLVAGLGNATGGTQFAGSGTIYAADAIVQPAVGAGFTLVAIDNAASKVWLTDITPGANWNTQTAGSYSVYITYVNIANI